MGLIAIKIGNRFSALIKIFFSSSWNDETHSDIICEEKAGLDSSSIVLIHSWQITSAHMILARHVFYTDFKFAFLFYILMSSLFCEILVPVFLSSSSFCRSVI